MKLKLTKENLIGCFELNKWEYIQQSEECRDKGDSKSESWFLGKSEAFDDMVELLNDYKEKTNG